MEPKDQPPPHSHIPCTLAGLPWDPFSGPYKRNTFSQEHQPCRPLWGNVASWGLHPLSLVTPLPTMPRLNHFESSHSASLQIRLDVSWVQESDAHEETGPCEGPQLPQAECALQMGVRSLV